MGLDGWIATGVVVLTLAALVLELAAPEVVTLMALALLMAFGVVEPSTALAGFGSTATITIAALFVIAAGVRKTGILGVVANKVLGPKNSQGAVLRLTIPVAAMSAFLNNTPVVAMFTPAVLDWCKRRASAPSKLLMPLSFAAILGGTCTLIGTSTTLVVDGLMRDAGLAGLGMFEIGWVGLPITLAGIALMWLLSSKLLPDRRDPMTEVTDERRNYIVEMMVESSSPLVGTSVGDAGLRNLPGLYLIQIERGDIEFSPVSPEEVLQGGDRLVFTGVASTIVDLRKFGGLTPAPEAHYDPEAEARRSRLFEAVVSRSSPLVNTTLKDIGFRKRYDAAVIAVHRAGERLPMKLGEIVLKPGDTLMVEASRDFQQAWSDSLDFALISKIRAEPAHQPEKARRAVVTNVVMVVLVALGVMPIAPAAILAVGAFLLLDILSVRQALRSINLSVLVVIAAALGLGQSLVVSGAASALGNVAGSWAITAGPLGALALVYIATLVLTEMVTNVAAVALMFPIATTIAQQSGYSVRAMAITVAIAASASFLSPVGYQTNLIVYGPGGYRFTDFLRFGFPLSLAVLAITLSIVPQIWPL